MTRFINIRLKGMIKKLIKAIFSSFIAILLFSFVLAGWTTYSLISQPSKSNEIIKVLKDIYSSQKSVVLDVIQLSKVLIKNTSESFENEQSDLLVEKDLLTNSEDNSQSDVPTVPDDNGDNPVGIVIEKTLTQSNEKILPELMTDSKQNDFPIGKTEKERHMDMDS